MQVIAAGQGPTRRAPIPAGPTAEVLVDARPEAAGRLAAAQVVIPPGGSMPEHAHGESEVLVVPLAGALVVTSGGQQEKVAPGALALVTRGERVRLDNPGDAPVTLLAVFAPGDFVRALASWPESPAEPLSSRSSGVLGPPGRSTAGQVAG